MSATINDKFGRAQNGGNPTVTTVSGSRSSGGTTLSAVNLDNWPTDTAVYFNTYKKTATGLKDFSTQRSWKAIVSGTTLGTLTIQDGVDDLGNDVGDFIEMGPTAAWADSLIRGVLTHANEDGTLKSGIPTSKLADDAGITNAKISDVSAVKFSNPYKFSVNSTTSQGSIGTGDTKISFQNEDYDTNSNFDNATNYNYTAPVAGFYQFNAFCFVGGGASTTSIFMNIYKNGSLYRRLDYTQGTAISAGMNGSILMSLAISDTVDIRIGTTGAAASTSSTATIPARFEGFLVSAT